MTEKEEMQMQAEAPWLILTHDNDDEELGTHTFCTIDNKSYTKTISELQSKLILASSQGWLILQQQDDSSKYSLWNPVTRQCLLLPDLSEDEKEDRRYTFSILTSPPDPDPDPYGNNDDFCVLLFFEGLLFWCKPTMGDEGCRWVKQSLELDGQSVLVTHAAALNGGDTYVYALVSHSHEIFARVKVSSSSSTLVLFEPLEIKPPYQGINNCRVYQHKHDYLADVGGVLYAIHGATRQLELMDDYDLVKMYVWRLDLSEMNWIHVESLGGDRALLLGYECCSTWCWADHTGGIEGDCIYIINSGSRIMHQYRLQDDSCDFLWPSPHLHQIRDTRWFMPRNRTRLTKTKMDVPLIIEKLEDTDEKLRDMKIEMPASSSSSICQLHLDMLISIIESLHLFDYMGLRATCKTLRSKIPQPQLGSSKSSYPLFMSRKNNKGGICELWDPFQNTYHSRNVMTPHLSNYMVSIIEFCKDGWLLLRIDGEFLQCFNPFEGKSYKYPFVFEICCPSNIAFSTCPTLPDCVTVGIFGYGNKVDIMYFRTGNERWEFKRIDLDEGVEFVSNYNCSPKYLEGSFYFLDMNGNLLVLKMVADGEWCWTVHKGPIPEDTTLNSCYLVELDAELVSVFIERLGRRVRVFRFNTLDKVWVALQDLGDHMLFVSPGSSLSVPTKDKRMRNRIYLPKRMGNEMVFYSLDTTMYHTSSNQYSEFYGMRSHPFCCWL